MSPFFAAAISLLSETESIMIVLSRLNGVDFYLNPNLIETVEKTPDTVIRLTTEHTIIVRESPEEIRKRIIEYNREIFQYKTEI